MKHPDFILQKESYLWATRIIGRASNRLKAHKTIGSAKGAINYTGWNGVRGGALYVRVSDGWLKVAEVAPNTPLDESRKILAEGERRGKLEAGIYVD